MVTFCGCLVSLLHVTRCRSRMGCSAVKPLEADADDIWDRDDAGYVTGHSAGTPSRRAFTGHAARLCQVTYGGMIRPAARDVLLGSSLAGFLWAYAVRLLTSPRTLEVVGNPGRNPTSARAAVQWPSAHPLGGKLGPWHWH
jgi:hypothetical protein